MRNLKRALSLTLASVMLLGMMVVGSSAAGYPDVSEEENIEAIEVLQTVGVMEGDNNGNFNPDDYVTREQMAVIMSKLLNLDYNYYQGTNPFSDVPAWAAPYVAACAANGITSGIGGGMYGAGQNVNAVQAALMMLKALGYFQYQQDFGDDYVLATVKQATEVGLFKLIDSNAQQALTRNEVAQMSLNALQADLVRFTGDPGVEYTGTNGESWIGGYKAEYTPRTSTDPKYNRLIDNKHSSDIDHSGQYYCQLGEELYNGNLVKRIDSDIFERPAFTWTYKTEKIGTYVDREKLLHTYTTAVSGRDMYDLLNNITIRDYDLEVYVDGHEAGMGTNYESNGESYHKTKEPITSSELRRANTETLGATGDGVLTEVFIDRDKEIITIVSIHTWLAQASSAYSTTRNSAGLKVFTSLGSSGVVTASKTVNVEDVPEVEGVAADAFYLVQMSDKDTTDLEIVSIEEPQILTESTVTKFSNGLKNNTNASYPETLTTDGTDYKDSDRAYYDADTLDTYDKDLLAVNTYNIYLDKYGYFIGVDLCEGDRQYVFITGYDMKNSNLSIKTAEAAGIFLDGTMDTITVNVKDTNTNIANMVTNKPTGGTNQRTANEAANANAYYQPWESHKSDGVYLLNRWYTYTKNEAGVYTLKPCVDKYGVAMMLASKTQETGVEETDTLKLHCSSLRLDSVVDTYYTDSTHHVDVGDLLQGETMQYTRGTSAGDGSPILDSYRAYGEDASVFITVDVEEVSAVAGTNLRITRAITDVNGVYTGIQDVDIITSTSDRIVGRYFKNNGIGGGTIGGPAEAGDDTWSPTDNDGHFVSAGGGYSYLGENAYAVFDKNNFIIGAVILGEAEGNNATKAYIIDPVKYERYENGTYYWQFEAVINGEIVTQEAESKFQSTIDRMRNNQYEVVELRYNSENVVTDVKQLDRKDGTATTTPADNIYGNPFNEITFRRVADKESIYDVVLTGEEGASYDKDATASNTQVGFEYVTRPRYHGMDSDATNNNIPGHTAAGKTFTETELATLKLQGRTLYVLENQADYGIDFVRDAKAVVRQPVNEKMKTTAYSSVEEAIASLGDVDPTTDVKEFRGIITAVLNNSGVAEWVVFYSDTNVDTLNDANVGQATMDVQINVQLPGMDNVELFRIIKVPKPLEGNVAKVKNPTAYAADRGERDPYPGYTPKEDVLTVTWNKNYTNPPVLTFTYELASNNADRTAVKTAADKVEKEDNKIVTPETTTERAAKAAIKAYLEGAGIVNTASTEVEVEVEVTSFTASSAAARGSATVNITLKKGNAVETVEGLTFRLETVMGESGDTVGGITSGTGTNSAGVNAKPDGSYIFTDAETIHSGDIHGEAEENIFFKFTVIATGAYSGTLKIYDEYGTVMYSETATDTAAAASEGHHFYVQVISAAGDPLVNAGSGPMKTKGLPAGNYTWEITGTNVANVSGSFTIG